MNAGKWIASTNEEQFSDSSEEFDTWAEAFEYAINDFASDYGLQPGDRVYVGQVTEFTRETLAKRATSAESIIEDMDEYIYEHVGEDAFQGIDATQAQMDDLDSMLEATVVAWLTKHDLKSPSYMIENVRSYEVVRDFDAEEQATIDAERAAQCVP